MDIRDIAQTVLSEDAQEVRNSRESLAGRACGRVICEALADSAMKGDIKASELLMELAGEDVKSRELAWKHQAQTVLSAPQIVDVRPE